MATDPSAIFGGFGGMPDFSKAGPAAPQLFPFGGAQPPNPLLLPPPADSSQGATPPTSVPGTNSPPPAAADDSMRGFSTDAEASPIIDKLGPDTSLHDSVVQKLNAMWDFGKREMKKHYSRFNFAEQRVQAYTSIQDYERLMGEITGPNAAPPEPVSVIVPYSYATLHAAATYIHQVLVGRKPIFPLLATLGTESDRARYMETALQNNLDASRGQETLWQLIWDPLIYGFGVVKNGWEVRQGQTIQWLLGQRSLVNTNTFAGNVVAAVDPYAFVPDPRVPIHQCNIRGDFMFAETQISATTLKDMEASGKLKWVSQGLEKQRGATDRTNSSQNENSRRIKIGIRCESLLTPTNVTSFATVREGTVRLVPKDWGLGDSTQSQLWKFSWFQRQIIQAEPLGMIHNMHPMTATEPTSFGHDFMSISMHDMIGPFQDVLSWLVSSRMENVRTAINNQFIADPARVDINDVRASPIGRVIRLKQTAQGLPIKDAIMQLAVQDVTGGHITDIQTIRILADTITGINDNLRGINTAGGRRSATEARQSMQAGAQRLSSMAVRISAQAFAPLCLQMISNIQQFMPDKMWVQMTGDDGQMSSTTLTPEMVVGSFNYQISDGSLPFDKQALLEEWQEIMFGIAKDPELRATYSLPEIFRYVALLGGAKNIDQFKRQQLPAGMGQAPNPFLAGAAPNPGQQPGMVPLGPAMPQAPIVS
jgi:hypothetical protein